MVRGALHQLGPLGDKIAEHAHEVPSALVDALIQARESAAPGAAERIAGGALPVDLGDALSRGAAATAGSFLTPENAGFMASAQIPVRTMQVLAETGFSLDMLKGAYDTVPELKDAIDRKDWPAVVQVGTQLATSGYFGARTGISAVHGAVGGVHEAVTDAAASLRQAADSLDRALGGGPPLGPGAVAAPLEGRQRIGPVSPVFEGPAGPDREPAAVQPQPRGPKRPPGSGAVSPVFEGPPGPSVGPSGAGWEGIPPVEPGYEGIPLPGGYEHGTKAEGLPEGFQTVAPPPEAASRGELPGGRRSMTEQEMIDAGLIAPRLPKGVPSEGGRAPERPPEPAAPVAQGGAGEGIPGGEAGARPAPEPGGAAGTLERPGVAAAPPPEGVAPQDWLSASVAASRGKTDSIRPTRSDVATINRIAQGKGGAISLADLPPELQRKVAATALLQELGERLPALKGTTGVFRHPDWDNLSATQRSFVKEWTGGKSSLPKELQEGHGGYEWIAKTIEKGLSGKRLRAREQEYFNRLEGYAMGRAHVELTTPHDLEFFLHRAGADAQVAELQPDAERAAMQAPPEEGADTSFPKIEEPRTVYHGSPHEFDRFDAAHIGRGEGAQAYGHGLYFAERRGVAEDYRRRLGPEPTPVR